MKTATDALELTLKHWSLIREVVESTRPDGIKTTISGLKIDAFKKMDIGFRPIYDCFCCEFVGKQDDKLNCHLCPMAGLWSDDGSHEHIACEQCGDSPYRKLTLSARSGKEFVLSLVDDMIHRINLALEHHK